MITGAISSVVELSPVATGASFTAVIVILTVVVSVLPRPSDNVYTNEVGVTAFAPGKKLI